MTLQHEKMEMIKRETMMKEEMGKIKRYHKQKQNEMTHEYKKLTNNYELLRKIYEKGETKKEIFQL